MNNPRVVGKVTSSNNYNNYFNSAKTNNNYFNNIVSNYFKIAKIDLSTIKDTTSIKDIIFKTDEDSYKLSDDLKKLINIETNEQFNINSNNITLSAEEFLTVLAIDIVLNINNDNILEEKLSYFNSYIEQLIFYSLSKEIIDVYKDNLSIDILNTIIELIMKNNSKENNFLHSLELFISLLIHTIDNYNTDQVKKIFNKINNYLIQLESTKIEDFYTNVIINMISMKNFSEYYNVAEQIKNSIEIILNTIEDTDTRLTLILKIVDSNGYSVSLPIFDILSAEVNIEISKYGNIEKLFNVLWSENGAIYTNYNSVVYKIIIKYYKFIPFDSLFINTNLFKITKVLNYGNSALNDLKKILLHHNINKSIINYLIIYNKSHAFNFYYLCNELNVKELIDKDYKIISECFLAAIDCYSYVWDDDLSMINLDEDILNGKNKDILKTIIENSLKILQDRSYVNSQYIENSFLSKLLKRKDPVSLYLMKLISNQIANYPKLSKIYMDMLL